MMGTRADRWLWKDCDRQQSRWMGMGDDGMGWPGMAFHFRATCAAARTFQQSPCSAVSNRQRCQTMHTRLDKSEPHAAHAKGAGTLTCIP